MPVERVYMPRLVAEGYGRARMVILTTSHESTAIRRRLDKKAKEKTKEQRAFSEASSLGRKDSDDMLPTGSEVATLRSMVPVLTPHAMPRKPVLCRQDTLDRSKCLNLCLQLACYKAYTGLPLMLLMRAKPQLDVKLRVLGTLTSTKFRTPFRGRFRSVCQSDKTLYSPGWIFPRGARYRYGCVNNPI
jgi:hypothetical protein